MKNKLLWFVGLGAVGIWFYNYMKNVNQMVASLVFSPAGLSVDASNPFAPKLNIMMTVANPTTTDATLNKIFGIVKLDGNQIGTINNSNNQLIAANSNSHITLNCTIDTITFAMNFSETDLSNLDISFDGTYTANNIESALILDYKIPSIGSAINGNRLVVKSFTIFNDGEDYYAAIILTVGTNKKYPVNLIGMKITDYSSFNMTFYYGSNNAKNPVFTSNTIVVQNPAKLSIGMNELIIKLNSGTVLYTTTDGMYVTGNLNTSPIT